LDLIVSLCVIVACCGGDVPSFPLRAVDFLSLTSLTQCRQNDIGLFVYFCWRVNLLTQRDILFFNGMDCADEVRCRLTMIQFLQHKYL
jgi:hypothetical protein